MTRPAAPQSRATHASLVPAVLVMLGLLAVLPSSLRLPIAEPTETLEFAPVVPSEGDSSAGANGVRLGLAGRSGSGGGSTLETDPPIDPGSPSALGRGKNPSTKRCVGTPPLQTEDPLSPPCVADFSGDNFGSTYHGVTRNEVRVVVYVSGAYNSGLTSQGMEPRTCGRYTDLAKPPQDDEFIDERILRAYQRYFNERYQTYGRFVHMYVYPSCNPYTPEGVRADAALNRADIKPFAVIPGIGMQHYDRAMAEYGVLSFGIGSKPGAYYQQHPTLMWGFDATAESRAEVFAGYLCQKVVPHPVSFSGNGDTGRPRRLGLLVSNEDNARLMADRVTERLKRCGGRIVLRHPYTPYTGDMAPSEEGLATMSEFQREGITTMLYVGGPEYTMANSAAAIGYRPEIVVADPQNLFSRNSSGPYASSEVWRHAWTVTAAPKTLSLAEEYCWLAAKEAGVERAQPQDFGTWGGCMVYNQVQQLFTAIQVAGPRLSPASIATGFRAIPGVPSGNPRRPACFYPKGDNTCVKDATAAWWDPSGQPPNPSNGQPPGCWRLAEGGRRYLADGWARADANAVKNPGGDECNGW